MGGGEEKSFNCSFLFSFISYRLDFFLDTHSECVVAISNFFFSSFVGVFFALLLLFSFFIYFVYFHLSVTVVAPVYFVFLLAQ